VPKISLVFLPVILLSAPAAAQIAPTPDAASDAREGARGDILVTATRVPTTIDKIASAVTVLDKANIDRLGDIGVSDLLLRTPGVSFSRNGGYGTATSLRIRGAESDQTVVVIDGVKLNDPSQADGSYNFANLLVGDAARIEVLRGPQAVLWGSQAIGGVVNIVTPLPTRPLQGSIDLEAGSRRTASARASVGGITGPLAWQVAGQTFTTDGISAIDSRFGGKERDGYRNQNLQGRAVLTLSETVSADVRGYYAHGNTDIDATTGDSFEYALNTEWLGYAGLNACLLGGRFKNRIGYARTNTDRDNYNPQRARQLTFDSSGRNRRIEYEGTFAIADGYTLVFGAENEKASFRSVSPAASLAVPIPAPARGTSSRTGGYGELSTEPIRGLTLTGGVRHDANRDYGGKTLFEGGAVWALPTGTTLRARYGEGFKVPSLYQLFSIYGNTALRPASSHGWEAGAEQRLFGGALTIGATYFDRRTRDQIVFNSCPAKSTNPLCFQPGSTTARAGYYLNLSRAVAHGIEADATARLGKHLTLDGNYTWTVSEDRTPGATFGNWLPRRPRQQANGSATYVWPFGLSTGVTVRWAGHSFDNAANTTRLAGYTLVDLRTELPVKKSLTVFARAENLFDETYETAYRYGTLGRSVYAGVRARL
jgi:vitamin B12 transporter